jgi:hypothetical protein
MVYFQTKILIWVNFGMPYIGKRWYSLWPSVIFHGHLGYSMVIWYILCSFGTFFPVLVSCTKKNLATLSRVQGDQIGRIFPLLCRSFSLGHFLKLCTQEAQKCRNRVFAKSNVFFKRGGSFGPRFGRFFPRNRLVTLIATDNAFLQSAGRLPKRSHSAKLHDAA